MLALVTLVYVATNFFGSIWLHRPSFNRTAAISAMALVMDLLSEPHNVVRSALTFMLLV